MHGEIDDRLADFLLDQHVFFVATAPLSPTGRVNLSPKGLSGTLRVIDEHTVAYLDLTGSGVETIAHLRENGRIVVMVCSFEGPPRIVRLHGTGEVVMLEDPRFPALSSGFPPVEGARAVVVVHVDRVSDSCGYGVPLMVYRGDRGQLPEWSQRKGEEGLVDYRREKNAASIDGLAGIPDASGHDGREGVVSSVESIDHVQLAMPPGGEAVARDFYEGLLGIPWVPKPADLAARGGCWFECGRLKVHLGVEPEFRPARKAHPAFRVTGLAVLADRLRSAAVDVTDDEPLDGYERIYVHDPFGNRIELMEPLA